MPWDGGHYPPNKGTACGPVAEISPSFQNGRLLRSQVTYELKTIHNCLDVALSLMYHCKCINKVILLLRKSAVVS